MTVPAALKELDKIEMSRQFDGIYRLDHAVSKTQKVILKAFGLDTDSVIKSSHSVSSTLSKQAGKTIPVNQNNNKEQVDG